MKQNAKFGLLLLAASVLGSATTLFATSALQKSGELGFDDNYVAANADNQQPNGFIRTAGRMPAIETDFTKAAESTINSVVSIKSYAAPKRQQMQGGMFDPFEFSLVRIRACRATHVASSPKPRTRKKTFSHWDWAAELSSQLTDIL